MKKECFEERFPVVRAMAKRRAFTFEKSAGAVCAAAPDMGLAAGGMMRQEIYDDPFELSEWETVSSNRCFVHLANSLIWREITGKEPPRTPATSAAYTKAGLPWFDYYDDKLVAVEGSETLSKVKSIAELAEEKGDNPLPENETVDPKNVVALRAGLKKGEVRDGCF